MRIPIRFDRREWLGAFGDIGVLVPILLSLTVVNGIDLTRALAVAGISYIAAGLYFRLPVPVQPLKAMAAIALAQGLGLNVIRAGSLWMGILFLVLGSTGAIDAAARFFPKVIVKGLQLGVGVLLLRAAWRLLLPTPLPAAPMLSPTPALAPQDFLTSFFVLVLPQIPLTLGNAVFGASDALHVYYGRRARSASPRILSISIGLMNLAAGLFHGYPLCHGSGGVTAHARLGARTAGATILMGTLCLAGALFSGPTAYEVLARIPHPLLGVLLLYVGLCHGGLFLQLDQPGERLLAIAMGLVALFTNRLDWALGMGLLLGATATLFGFRYRAQASGS